jgi:outer membrane protein OmpA-like peptidoglycan-associated protein
MLRTFLILPLAGAVAGCATLAKGPAQPLVVSSTHDSATVVLPQVPEASGRTPHVFRVVPRAQLVVRAAPDDQNWAEQIVSRRFDRRTFLNLVNPVGWAVDLLTGAAWKHSTMVVSFSFPEEVVRTTDTVYVRIREAPADSVAAAVLAALAIAAADANCDSTVVAQMSDVAERAAAAAPPSGILMERATVAVETARTRLEDICARPFELDEAVAAELAEFERSLTVQPDDDLLEPIFFATDQTLHSEGDSNRLERVAQAIAENSGDIMLVVTGYADPAGTGAYNYRLGLARAAQVVETLWRHGAPRDCCIIRSLGSRIEAQVAPGRSGGDSQAHLNRRVTFEVILR